MQITNISDAKASLSSLIKQVQETNEPIIIGKAGNPIAILSAFKKDESPRKLGGSWEGNVKVMNGFSDGADSNTDQVITDSFYNSTLFPDS